MTTYLGFLAVTLLGAGSPTPQVTGPPFLPLGSSFTYQGQLRRNGVPVNGSLYFEFRLFLSPEGGKHFDEVSVPGVSVVDGLFTVELDFGPNVFFGAELWLEVAVSDAVAAGDATTLTPRQKLTGTPYSIQTRGLHVDSELDVAIGKQFADAALDVSRDWDGDNGALQLLGDKPTLRFSGGDAAGEHSWIVHVGGTGPGDLQFMHEFSFGTWQEFLAIKTNGAVRIPRGTDVGPAEGGYLQLGDDLGNIALDDNEIAARAFHAPTTLFFNNDGGNVVVSGLGTGRLGVGTVSPGSRLQVNGGVRARGGVPGGLGVNDNGYAFAGNGGDNDSGMFCVGDGRIDFYTDSVPRVIFDNSGLRVIGVPFIGDFHNVQWRSTDGRMGYDDSTRRHKENIKPLDDDFDRFLDAQPMTYTRPGAPDRWEIGYIAEDLQELGLSRLLQYDADGQPAAVNYEKSVLYLAAIAKAQRSKLAEQDARLAAYEKTLSELGDRLVALERTAQPR